jgi:TrmH family RNA methyltransferase
MTVYLQKYSMTRVGLPIKQCPVKLRYPFIRVRPPMLKHNNFIFILVRPVFIGNIGSVARVLKNFGFHNLRLVEPPRNYKDSEARRMSAGAFDLLKQAPVYDSLAQALHDVSMSIGTTAGQFRNETPEPIIEVVPQSLDVSQANKVAWVFGDERNGLAKDDLQRCHRLATIPTNIDFPSLNISQAVGTVAYELSCRHKQINKHAVEYPNRLADDQLFAQIEALLTRLEFTRSYNHQVILNELRVLYQKNLPSNRQYAVLTGLLRRINQKLDACP